jgi:hypothetical protein
MSMNDREQLRNDIVRLEAELAVKKSKLARLELQSLVKRSAPAVHNQSAPADKISLFTSLFRGRPDVYARRFESIKSGKSGYQPACAHEWARGFT